MNELRQELEDSLQKGLTDEAVAYATKKFKDIVCSLEEDLESSIKGDIAYNLASYAKRMAEEAVKAILAGNEEQMRRYLSCQEGCYNGRDREHPVIHGRLFETGAIELRRQIVDAHAELLKNERILDLEDQVKSLVAQVNKAEARFEELRRYQEAL